MSSVLRRRILPIALVVVLFVVSASTAWFALNLVMNPSSDSDDSAFLFIGSLFCLVALIVFFLALAILRARLHGRNDSSSLE